MVAGSSAAGSKSTPSALGPIKGPPVVPDAPGLGVGDPLACGDGCGLAVGNGDTVEQLASRMAVADHKLERFRILNGLEPASQLSPGDLVKIVVE